MTARPRLLPTILLTGGIAGTLDMIAACTSTYIRSGKGPAVVCKFIAGGILGKQAFTGGTGVIILGLLLHYVIAFAFTTVFFLLYPRLQRLISLPLFVTALVYGLMAWCIMNLVVVPLSALPPFPQNTTQIILGMAFLVFFIGLPAAVMARGYYRK